jgi:hypothetical protein
MPKRHRVRARARRPIESAARVERVERERVDRPARPRYRGAPIGAATARAIGEASPTLERAAVAERTYVMKDFRRLGIVVAVMLVLLVASGFGVQLLLR